MNKNIILSLSVFTIFAAFAVVSANAQISVAGKYFYDKRIDEGRNILRLIFELKDKNTAVYSNEQDGNETQKRYGTWKYNAKTKQITITFPPVKKNPLMGQEVKLTFVLEFENDALKLVKDLPYREGNGEIYQRF